MSAVMDMSSIIVAAIAFAGTFVGSVAGIFASNKLVQHRLRELERKVDKHNNLVERMMRVETILRSLCLSEEIRKTEV